MITERACTVVLVACVLVACRRFVTICAKTADLRHIFGLANEVYYCSMGWQSQHGVVAAFLMVGFMPLFRHPLGPATRTFLRPMACTFSETGTGG